MRVDQLLGRPSESGFLLRGTSDLVERAHDPAALSGFSLLAPRIRGVWNSDLPFSLNDGALWAGRGWSTDLSTGLWLRAGPVTLMLAPQLVHQENEPFQVVIFDPRRARDRPRSPFADPFHPLPESIDQPLRFGPDPTTRIYPGQSSVVVDLEPVEVGVTTEDTWWGPGIRNAILLSNHAPGVPRIFLRTKGPRETPLGEFDARWFVGRLDESDFFDRDPTNDKRSLSAFALTFRPARAPSLTVGVARSVIAPLDDDELAVTSAFDAFRNVGRPNATEPPDDPDPRPDQIFSFFGRWLLSSSGLEFYWEWARFEQPESLDDFLEFPQHSQGYTLGVQWAAPVAPDTAAAVRLQGEVSFLEPSATFRSKPVFSSYTSRVVPQGYTHEGQVLGAAIGPAASSQWLAADYLRKNWRIGTFLGRIRWENQVLFQDIVPTPKREDVSLFGGLRGSVRLLGLRLTAEYTTGIRLNYLFQATPAEPGTGKTEGVDIANTTLSLTLSSMVGG